MKKKLLLWAALLPMALSAQVFDSSTEATKVPTKYGEVAGYIERGVYTYKGIPYGKARLHPRDRSHHAV